MVAIWDISKEIVVARHNFSVAQGSRAGNFASPGKNRIQAKFQAKAYCWELYMSNSVLSPTIPVKILTTLAVI